MIVFAHDLLTAPELASVQASLATATFVPGANTAGGAAREVKTNEQVDPRSHGYTAAAELVRNAFMRNAKLRTALLPKAFTTVMFNRYAHGTQYGPHVDSPLMGTLGNLLRADIAITLFLSDPASYDGGQLTVKAAGTREYSFKEPAGTAVAYPANEIHHVTPVTRGARLAAIIWMQSLVRDPGKRKILWDLEQAQRELYQKEGRTPVFEAVHRSQTNLLRLWAEP